MPGPLFLSNRDRLYPLRERVPRRETTFHELNFLWTPAHDPRTSAGTTENKRVPYLDPQGRSRAWRAYNKAGLGKATFTVAMDPLQRPDLAFKAFFRRWKEGTRGKKAGYPKFHRETTSRGYQVLRIPVRPGAEETWRPQVPRIDASPFDSTGLSRRGPR